MCVPLIRTPVFAQKATLPVKYRSGTADLTITKKTFYGTRCYVARLNLKGKKGYRRFSGGISRTRSGETALHFAGRTGAVFAVSGDWSYFNGYVCVRGGKIHQGSGWCVPAAYSASTGKLFAPSAAKFSGKTLKSLVKSGEITNTFCFGPAFLVKGKITVGKSTNQKNGKGRPRAFIGTDGKPGHVVIVVTEGADSRGGNRSDGKSYGLTGWQCASVLKKLGCKFGVPLDGGGSVQMVYKGKFVNNAGKISWTRKGSPEIRKLSDFYCLK